MHRQNKKIQLPPLGQPGGLDDPLRRGLSGAGYRWYLRYLEEGFTPEAARMKAAEHRNPFLANSGSKNSNLNNSIQSMLMGGSGYQYNSNNSGPPVESHYRSDISDRNGGSSSSLRRPTGRECYLSPPPPRSSNGSSRAEEIQKRTPKAEPFRLDKADFSRSGTRRFRNRRSKPYKAREIFDGATNPSGDVTTKSKPGKFETETRDGIRFAVLPTAYPHETLTREEAQQIEDGIVEALMNVTTTKPQFNRIQGKSGLVLLDCINQETVNWLVGIIPKLPKWEGKPLTTCSEAEIPKTYTLSFLLPRSAGPEIEKALSLIAFQNDGVNTDKWKVLNHRDCHCDKRVTVMIDEKSLEVIKANGNKFSYRFEKVKIHGLKYLEANKIAEEPDIKKEDVDKTANGDVTVKKETNDNENAEEHKDDGDYVVVDEEEYGDEEEVNDDEEVGDDTLDSKTQVAAT